MKRNEQKDLTHQHPNKLGLLRLS